MSDNFDQDGYLLLDLGISQEEVDKINAEVAEYGKSESRKKQDDGYTYSDSERLFEAWRTCPGVCALACNEKIRQAVRDILMTGCPKEDAAGPAEYGWNPIPFQTINFQVGSNQPLHSDLIHFQSVPANLMVGVWVALEDMDDQNGTLCVVPGSHKWKVYDLQHLGWPRQEYGKQFAAYRAYEDFLIDLVRIKEATVREIYCKAGTAIVWAANLLHGGAPIRDPKRTRKSQAIHYYLEGCRYYCPLFSDTSRSDGYYAWKDLSGKGILGQHRKNLQQS